MQGHSRWEKNIQESIELQEKEQQDRKQLQERIKKRKLK